MDIGKETIENAFAAHEAREIELMDQHAKLDDRRFADIADLWATRTWWGKLITVTNIVVILGFLGGLATFFIVEHDRGVTSEAAIVSLTASLDAFRSDILTIRQDMLEDARNNRALAKQDRVIGREKDQQARDIDRDAAHNSTRTPKK